MFRQYNPYTIAEATSQFPLIDFKTFIQSTMEFASKKAQDTVLTTPNYQILIKEKKQLADLTAFLKDTTKVDPNTVYNYLWYRLIEGKKTLLPSNHATKTEVALAKMKQTKPMGVRKLRSATNAPTRHYTELAVDNSAIESSCASENTDKFRFASARFLVDEMLPTQDVRDKFLGQVALMASKIVEGFRVSLFNWFIRMDIMYSGTFVTA